MQDGEWDVIIIGGGPAGLMAAAAAASSGERVLLLEKNAGLGRKLLISGGGRCNFTNAETDNHKLAAQYGAKGRFLLSPFSKFSASDCLAFFKTRGMDWKIENDKRAFPVSDDAGSVLAVLREELSRTGVIVRTAVRVLGLSAREGRIEAVKTQQGPLRARRFILATGGTSRPETGSTGDGYRWLAALGHSVREPEPSLVPISVSEKHAQTLQGLSFPEVRLTLMSGGSRRESRVGKILFTHFGLSGPLVLNLSTTMSRLAEEGPLIIALDFFPKLDEGSLGRLWLSEWKTVPNRKVKNALASVLPPRLASLLIRLAGIDADVALNQWSKDSRQALLRVCKDFRLTFTGLLGEDWAVVSSGGVALEEVDFRTMASRLYPNLRLAGDILDFDRPSGGFSLQICWATGYVAGKELT